MLDDFFASIAEFCECRDEFFCVELRLRCNFERFNNRVAQMLQESAHTRDDYFRSVVFDAPQNLEAFAHRFAVWADAFKRQGLPSRKECNIALWQKSDQIIAQLISHQTCWRGDDDDFIFGSLSKTCQQQRPCVISANYRSALFAERRT